MNRSNALTLVAVLLSLPDTALKLSIARVWAGVVGILGVIVVVVATQREELRACKDGRERAG